MTTMVVKTGGLKEPYSEDKIRASATRVGVQPELLQTMLEDIRERLFDGISTHEIYLMIKDFLRSSASPHLAMKYNLKEALAELGPSGYPFEKYLAMLLSATGYITKTNQILEGCCVSHEVDVLAVKGDTTYFIEAKFHKSPIQRTDIRIALYIKARYDDLVDHWEGGATQAWIMTNTRFSTDAIKYSECNHERLTSWSYPKGEGIADLVERTGLHPITMIDVLSPADKARLLAAGVVTCSQLLDPANAYLLSSELLASIRQSLQGICQNQTI
jgi:hypothetical protein